MVFKWFNKTKHSGRISVDFAFVTRLFAQYGTKIIVINSSENKSAEEELFEDLMSIIHSFSIKAHSKRRLAKKLLGEEDANNA